MQSSYSQRSLITSAAVAERARVIHFAARIVHKKTRAEIIAGAAPFRLAPPASPRRSGSARPRPSLTSIAQGVALREAAIFEIRASFASSSFGSWLPFRLMSAFSYKSTSAAYPRATFFANALASGPVPTQRHRSHHVTAPPRAWTTLRGPLAPRRISPAATGPALPAETAAISL
jgi:hypothetical protein